MKKKITKATFKSFLRKNEGNIYVAQVSHFRHDNVRTGFHKATESTRAMDNAMGVDGVWLVGGSRDWFTAYEDESYVGIKVSNCVCEFKVAVKK